jgi:DNA-binding PadR family transcriptional regulator
MKRERKRMGKTQIVVLRAIRDHPKKAYGKGIFEVTEGLFMEQIYLAITRMNNSGLIEQAEEAPGHRVFFGSRRFLYAITDKGREAIRKHEESEPGARENKIVLEERERCARVIEGEGSFFVGESPQDRAAAAKELADIIRRGK